jgi:hypothetical protein
MTDFERALAAALRTYLDGQPYIDIDSDETLDEVAAYLAAHPAVRAVLARSERIEELLGAVARRVEAEWYNGNVDEGARDRILAGVEDASDRSERIEAAARAACAPTVEELDTLTADISAASYASEAVWVVEEWTRRKWGVVSALTARWEKEPP